MKFKTRLQPATHSINLTPLVDVIFLLLIFFILTSNTLPFKSLNIHPPQLREQSAPLTAQLMVAMDENYLLYVGPQKTLIDLPDLEPYLKNAISARQNPTIVFFADHRVDYGTFLQTFAILQKTGARIRLAYTNEDPR